MGSKANDEELLAGTLLARIERWLELEGVFTRFGTAVVERIPEQLGGHFPARAECRRAVPLPRIWNGDGESATTRIQVLDVDPPHRARGGRADAARGHR